MKKKNVLYALQHLKNHIEIVSFKNFTLEIDTPKKKGSKCFSKLFLDNNGDIEKVENYAKIHCELKYNSISEPLLTFRVGIKENSSTKFKKDKLTPEEIQRFSNIFFATDFGMGLKKDERSFRTIVLETVYTYYTKPEK